MHEHRRAVDDKIQIQGDTMKINQLGQVAEAKMKCNETPAGTPCPVHGLKECEGYSMKEGKKPDFLDIDKDGNKKEPMKKAVADKKEVNEAHIVSMHVEDDHEVQMAQGDLYQMAKKTIALHKMLDNVDQLEGWVQGKITLAADYIATVYDYMDHHLAMAGNIDGLGESIVPTGSTVSAKKLPPQTAQVVKKVAQGLNPAQHSVMTDKDGNVSVVNKKDVTKRNAQGEMEVTEDDKQPAGQYKSLNDVYPAGSTEIWYWKEDFARDAMMGPAFMIKHGVMPTPDTVKDHYALIGKIAETKPEKIFMMMQGDMWSPKGQGRNMIRASGTGHTSMSVGDIIKIGNDYLMVDRFGFHKLGDQPQEESVRLVAKPIDESVMSEVHAELSEIAQNEDFDALYNLMSANTPAGKYVQNLADDIAIDHRLHPDDDFEKIEEYLMDRIVDEFGVAEAANPAQQAAIAINMKKRGKKPMGEADQPEADGNENGIYQMRKVVNLRGQYDVPFADGKKVRVPVNIAQAVLQKYANMKMPADKLAFTRAVTKSFDSLKNAIGFSEDVDARAKKIFGEDWGSSDTSAAINMMKEYIRSTHGGRYNPETIEDAARDAAETYYQDMGYDSPEEAADSLVSHFVRRWMSGSLKAD